MNDVAHASWLNAQWAAPPGVIAGTTTRYCSVDVGRALGMDSGEGFNLGNKSADTPQQVAANRGLLRQILAQQANPLLGKPPHLHWLDQVHGDDWIYADGHWSDEPQADAMWTDQPGTGLAIQSADCVPILIASRHPTRPCVGAAHGGWRGLMTGVIEQLVGAMPAAPSDLCAWIGPCISQPHFEVGAEVWQPVAQVDPSAIARHPTDPAKRLVNLPQVVQYQLNACGVTAIAQSGLCTYADPRFYSYRQATHQQGKGAQTGRMASVVCMMASPGK